jgi:(4S)-4-hydroxy-5-phosphonooxypentane-2,3-dione isomerase
MYSVLSQLTIQPHYVEEFITLIRDHASESLRDEAGTLRFDVIQDEAAPNRFYVYETYVDEAAFHVHMQGPIGKRNFPRIAALVSGKLDNSIFVGKGFNIAPAETFFLQ